MIVAICGRQQAGKDHAAATLVKNHGFTRLAFADPMRKALYDLNPIIDGDAAYDVETDIKWDPIYLQQAVDMLGWDVAKEKFPEIRRLLQRFGTEMGRNNFGEDFWLDLAWRQVQDGQTVITDARFANELQRVKTYGTLWRIENESLEPEDLTLPRYSHASEKDWRQAIPHVVLYNPGKSGGYNSPYRYEKMVDAALEVTRSLDKAVVDALPVKVSYPANNSWPRVEGMTREELEALTGLTLV